MILSKGKGTPKNGNFFFVSSSLPPPVFFFLCVEFRLLVSYRMVLGCTRIRTPRRLSVRMWPGVRGARRSHRFFVSRLMPTMLSANAGVEVDSARVCRSRALCAVRSITAVWKAKKKRGKRSTVPMFQTVCSPLPPLFPYQSRPGKPVSDSIDVIRATCMM